MNAFFWGSEVTCCMLQNQLKDVSQGICKLARGLYTGQSQRLGPAGFAFDIDGVLVRGGGVLSEAKEAMALLHDGAAHSRSSGLTPTASHIPQKLYREPLPAPCVLPYKQRRIYREQKGRAAHRWGDGSSPLHA